MQFTWTKMQTQALKESIRHWEKIVAGRCTSYTACDCACCKQLGCSHCPIAKYTGTNGCRDTPYDDLMEQRNRRGVVDNYGRMTPEDKVIAIKELEFLKSVLAEGDSGEDFESINTPPTGEFEVWSNDKGTLNVKINEETFTDLSIREVQMIVEHYFDSAPNGGHIPAEHPKICPLCKEEL